MDTFDDFPISYENARALGCFRAWNIRVVDGDTDDFILDLGCTVRIKLRGRINGFDTAEFFHPRNDAELQHAIEAIEFVTDLAFDKPCLVRTYRTKSGTDTKTLDRYVIDFYYHNELGQWQDIKIPMEAAGLRKRESYD